MDTWNGSVLMISARSPFARRVRIALRENGIRYEEKVFDVFKTTPELRQANPLRRVPVLVLPSGERLVDSNLILESLYRELRADGKRSPFEPASAADQRKAAYWSGIGAGFCDRLVEYFLETLRPESGRDAEVIAEFAEIVTATLTELEGELAGRKQILVSGLCQADFDLGTALAYLKLRYSSDWTVRYPGCAAYLEALDGRASFAATRPPAA